MCSFNIDVYYYVVLSKFDCHAIQNKEKKNKKKNLNASTYPQICLTIYLNTQALTNYIIKYIVWYLYITFLKSNFLFTGNVLHPITQFRNKKKIVIIICKNVNHRKKRSFEKRKRMSWEGFTPSSI